jgi:uncharacterized delta-60 repeat protein
MTSRHLPLVLCSSLVLLMAACSSSDNSSPFNPNPSPSPSPSPSPEPTPAEISVLQNLSTDAANDLRGLTYAANGKIYASGHSDADAEDRVTVVMRFNADGTPDQTFGDGDGVVTLNLADGGDEQSLGVVELSNGDVVAVANVADGNGGEPIIATDNAEVTEEREEGVSVMLVRLDDSGERVSSFGADGVAEVPFGWANADNGDWPVPTLTAADGFSHSGFPRDTAWDVQLDTSSGEDKLVVFGLGAAAQADSGEQRVDNDRFVARVLASDGSIDPDFSGGNAFTFATDGTLGDNARRGTVLEDGTIISAGYTNLGAGFGNHIYLLQLTPDGALDPAFPGFGNPVGDDQDGVAIFNPLLVDGGFAEAYAAVPLSDGSLVTTGYGNATSADTPSTLGYETSVAQDVVVFRVSDGAIDNTFGNDGTQVVQSEDQGLASSEDRGRHLVALADDRTVHVGRFGGTAAIFVFTADGQLDTSVDDDGILLPAAPDGIVAQFFGVALSPDGTRIATTTNSDGNGVRLVILGVDAE